MKLPSGREIHPAALHAVVEDIVEFYIGYGFEDLNLNDAISMVGEGVVSGDYEVQDDRRMLDLECSVPRDLSDEDMVYMFNQLKPTISLFAVEVAAAFVTASERYKGVIWEKFS